MIKELHILLAPYSRPDFSVHHDEDDTDDEGKE
eukprot:CAMPEP_0119529612 /NCGR_PEP_ID=MMETSP1344-20130328/43596_1 /TAXON_ID=236787 /ORGANISM="Florenciella parvula, Strain CCMP2471" /LENGTH=32 /DNA_ID= /DNA_START= /DNA_END= /DNA_ORIENTATION=